MADPASNLLSDALMGKSGETSGETPVALDTSLESANPAVTPPIDMSLPSASATIGSAKPTWEDTPTSAVSELPSTEIPIPSPSPEPLQATPVPIEPGKPVEAVSPTGAPIAPPTVSSLPPAPAKKSIPPAAIAGLVVLAVVTVGVVAAVTLSLQSQELRQRAFVAQPTPVPVDRTASPDEIVVVPSAENSFVAVKNQYPNAETKPIVSDGIRGTLYIANNPTLESKVFFAEVTGLRRAEDSVPMAWLVYPDGSFQLIGEVNLASANGQKGYIVSEQFTELANASGFEISYENPSLQYDSAATQLPSQRILHVDL